MRLGIVQKLFLFTTGLCMFILFVVFVGQTFFFQKYYASRKVNDIKTYISTFQQNYAESGGDTATVQRMEQDFYREHGTWITLLDQDGNIKYAEDFYLEVEWENTYAIDRDEVSQPTAIKIPLYHFINVDELPRNEEEWSYLIGTEIIGSGIERDDAFIPVMLLGQQIPDWENPTLSKLLKESELESTTVIIREDTSTVSESLFLQMRGTITGLTLPDMNQTSTWIYSTPLFLAQIQEFQGNILFDEEKVPSTTESFDYEINDVQYKVFIEPIQESDGTTTYIFAMASLQPVNEAVQMIQDYYIYVILFVFVLIFLASFYYSKQIAKPLLTINSVTEKIVQLDFTEKVHVSSKDEIGDLSRNINTLSDELHSHIQQLHEDIEKERALEKTRKEFISNVSHELKTPLSVMKSCISILKDGVAPQKRDYYFQAMEKEVDKMDVLILDMLELAKLESGTYKMEKNIFYVDEIVMDITKKLAGEMDRRELVLETQLLPIQVYANQRYIEQVITNFVTNAIFHTSSKEKIIITMAVETDRVKVSVENTGAHIPAEQLEKVWEQFYRGDSSRKRSEGGTGLGLAISKNILALHQVEYGARNTDDGVLFFFYLPISKE